MLLALHCQRLQLLNIAQLCCASQQVRATLSSFSRDCCDQACDVLYTDLMSLMFPDDNTHSLMLVTAVLR